jgi:hypothetical protein
LGRGLAIVVAIAGLLALTVLGLASCQDSEPASTTNTTAQAY